MGWGWSKDAHNGHFEKTSDKPAALSMSCLAPWRGTEQESPLHLGLTKVSDTVNAELKTSQWSLGTRLLTFPIAFPFPPLKDLMPYIIPRGPDRDSFLNFILQWEPQYWVPYTTPVLSLYLPLLLLWSLECLSQAHSSLVDSFKFIIYYSNHFSAMFSLMLWAG